MWPGSALSKLTYKNETKNETQFTKYALLFKNKIFRNNHENQQSLPLCSLLVPFFSPPRGPSQCPHTLPHKNECLLDILVSEIQKSLGRRFDKLVHNL